MRVVSLVASAVALMAIMSVAMPIPRRGTFKESPWKIIESWTKQMPGGRAMEISPVYTSIKDLYYTTSADGSVWAVNSTNQQIAWNYTWSDIAFIQAVTIDSGDALIVGCNSGTYAVAAKTGAVLWSNNSIVIQSDLTNHGDRNFLQFGGTVIYRETNLGYTRLCALDLSSGTRIWCDTFRIIGLPDAAHNNTFTAPLYDVNGRQYAANFDVATGTKNWLYATDTVLTGNPDYVAVAKGTHIVILDSMSGAVVSSRDIMTEFQGTAVMVHGTILAVCDGVSYVAAIDMQYGDLMWNVSVSFQGMMQLQHRGDGVLVLAVLSSEFTNFTRFDAYQGNRMWTASARPTGMSLAPVHGWLGNDILYCVTKNGWSAYGVDTGDVISQGKGDLFLPRSVAADAFEPHVGYFVTGPEGIVYHLKIVPRN